MNDFIENYCCIERIGSLSLGLLSLYVDPELLKVQKHCGLHLQQDISKLQSGCASGRFLV